MTTIKPFSSPQTRTFPQLFFFSYNPPALLVNFKRCILFTAVVSTPRVFLLPLLPAFTYSCARPPPLVHYKCLTATRGLFFSTGVVLLASFSSPHLQERCLCRHSSFQLVFRFFLPFPTTQHKPPLYLTGMLILLNSPSPRFLFYPRWRCASLSFLFFFLRPVRCPNIHTYNLKLAGFRKFREGLTN